MDVMAAKRNNRMKQDSTTVGPTEEHKSIPAEAERWKEAGCTGASREWRGLLVVRRGRRRVMKGEALQTDCKESCGRWALWRGNCA
jgi:hypothetical protein